MTDKNRDANDRQKEQALLLNRDGNDRQKEQALLLNEKRKEDIRKEMQILNLRAKIFRLIHEYMKRLGRQSANLPETRIRARAQEGRR
jgi:hypothetical protein